MDIHLSNTAKPLINLVLNSSQLLKIIFALNIAEVAIFKFT